MINLKDIVDYIRNQVRIAVAVTVFFIVQRNLEYLYSDKILVLNRNVGKIVNVCKTIHLICNLDIKIFFENSKDIQLETHIQSTAVFRFLATLFLLNCNSIMMDGS